MPAQTQVELYRDIGVPGAKASKNPAVYTVNNHIAIGPVPAGGFAWANPADPEATASAFGADAPLGFVERNIVYPNYTPMDPGTLVIPEGGTLTIAVKGDFYAMSTTAAVLGQAIFADLADGSISTDDPGAVVAGAVETGWTVKKAGAAGEVIIISNWS